MASALAPGRRGTRGWSRRARGPGHTARRPGRSRGRWEWRCGGCRCRASVRRSLATRDRQEVEDPAAAVVDQHDRQLQVQALRGEQAADVVGERDVADQQHDRPVAVRGGAERARHVPSMPLAPRLHSTRGGSARTGQNVSISRTGIEEATNRVACSGSSTPSSAATAGSLSSAGAEHPEDRLGGALVGGAPAASQSGSAGDRRGMRRRRRGRLPRRRSCRRRRHQRGQPPQCRRGLQRERVAQHRRWVLPGALGVERHLRDIRSGSPASCAAALRPAGRRREAPGRAHLGGELLVAQQRVVVGDRRIPAPRAGQGIGQQRPARRLAERGGGLARARVVARSWRPATTTPRLAALTSSAAASRRSRAGAGAAPHVGAPVGAARVISGQRTRRLPGARAAGSSGARRPGGPPAAVQ